MSHPAQSLWSALKELSRHRIKFNALAELRFVLSMLYSDIPPSFGQRIQALASEFEFKDMEDVQSFMGLYNNYYNAMVELITAMEESGDIANEAVDTFKQLYKKDFDGTVASVGAGMIAGIMEFSEPDIESEEVQEELKMRLSDEGFENLYKLSHMLAIRAPAEDILRQILALTLSLNIRRKQKVAVRAQMGNGGRNLPCPCGSGRKYKHCCLY